jgi:hypothetical protein
MSVIALDNARPASNAAASHVDMIKRVAKLVMAVGLITLVVAAVVGAKVAIFVPRILH